MIKIYIIEYQTSFGENILPKCYLDKSLAVSVMNDFKKSYLEKPKEPWDDFQPHMVSFDYELLSEEDKEKYATWELENMRIADFRNIYLRELSLEDNIKDVVDLIGIDEIKETFNLYSKDEVDIDWFDDYDIEREFNDRNLGEDEMDNTDMIYHLESEGFKVLENSEVDDGLDYMDASKLEEIKDKYLKSNWQEREEIYNKIINNK